MAGVGVELEGPLGSAGSWLAAGRRSYLELLKEQIGYATPSPTTDGTHLYAQFGNGVVTSVPNRLLDPTLTDLSGK